MLDRGARRVYAVDVTTGAGFVAGIPRKAVDLPAGALFAFPPSAGYDVSPDGKSFLGILTKPSPEPPLPTTIQLTLNGFEELRARAPAR